MPLTVCSVDSDVRADMSDALDRIAPEQGPKGEDLYRHAYVRKEGFYAARADCSQR
jgi:thiamine phosphate synthase YjbQ (UPF0047 family)